MEATKKKDELDNWRGKKEKKNLGIQEGVLRKKNSIFFFLISYERT